MDLAIPRLVQISLRMARAVLADDQQSSQFYLSSPKRYAWDDLSIGLVAQHWEQIPNEHDADAGQFKPLGGLIRLFMHPIQKGDRKPAHMFRYRTVG